MMKKYLPVFLKAILAGLMIGIGACAYLAIENHYVGAMLFTIGLFTIYSLDFYLYTGKVGYLLEDKDFVKIIVIWVGNFLGITTTARLIMATRITTKTHLVEGAYSYAETKLTDGLISVFILAIFCGIMMYIAAQAFKSTQNSANSIGGYVGLFLCVMVFLLLGFEHSIANMFYFTVASSWSLNAIFPILIVTLGNAVGALLIPSFNLLMSSESIKYLNAKN